MILFIVIWLIPFVLLTLLIRFGRKYNESINSDVIKGASFCPFFNTMTLIIILIFLIGEGVANYANKKGITLKISNFLWGK